MNRNAVERELRALVRRVAPHAKVFFPRQGSRRRVRYSWNGRHLRPTGLTLESICHEVAHLLVSSPGRRHLPEFGIGPDPYRHSDAAVTVPAAEASREEDDACTMQLVVARVLGLDEAAIMDEVFTAALSAERVRDLRARFERALPSAWWEKVEASFAGRQSVAAMSPNFRAYQ